MNETETPHTAAAAPSPPPRPHLDERPAYVPRTRQEQFIVPLLERNIVAAMERWLRPKAAGSARVLDVGCGRQPFRHQLERMGFSYTSVDAVQNPEGTIDFIQPVDEPVAPALHDAGPFDVIFCTEVLEHVAGWEQAFQNFCSLLKPGGRVLLTAPHVYLLHEEPYDFWRPTPHAIRHFAQRSGFEVLELAKLGDAADVVGTLLACFKPAPASRGVAASAMAGTANLLRRVGLLLLASRVVRRRVSFASSLYLSNLAVLEKSGA